MPLYASATAYWVVILSMAAIFLLANKEKYGFLKKIHREQKVGSVISALALGWSGWQGYTLLGQDFPGIASIIPILVPALIVGVYVLMDYVFTRALGGLMIMLICDLLAQVQGELYGGQILFSMIAYIFAILGMYMIGQPWRFRNLLFKSIETPEYGKKLATVIIVFNVAMFSPLVFSYV